MRLWPSVCHKSAGGFSPWTHRTTIALPNLLPSCIDRSGRVVGYSEVVAAGQIKEIPMALAQGLNQAAHYRETRDFPDVWTDLVHLILMGAPIGCP